jgi:hypothetical protein
MDGSTDFYDMAMFGVIAIKWEALTKILRAE